MQCNLIELNPIVPAFLQSLNLEWERDIVCELQCDIWVATEQESSILASKIKIYHVFDLIRSVLKNSFARQIYWDFAYCFINLRQRIISDPILSHRG